ncbi:MAG: DUF4956 domain-containing protein [Clostridiales bacterium]|nr:DUF4956 domain-containing protein [Clostridiales bacterium]
MLDTIFSSAIGETLTFTGTLIIILASLVLGLIISLGYMHTHRREGYSASFTVTLIMLPAIISIIILLVGNNVARAFSLAGAFSLIRFRSAPGDPKDIAYVFFTLGVGLACGMGYIGYAALFAVILCLVMEVLAAVRFGSPRHTSMSLRITIPENLNYQGLFDDILAKNTVSWHLKRVKTCDFGALFELTYQLELKNDCDQKEFLDSLRCLNGNLSISLTQREYEDRVSPIL